ncbi:hypothetical protein FKW77_004719 [Venturia effusa]|uniref:Uncharacterized protein n=1 Tax=Venturia effusa TaxID=50376 RepID=A0A517LH33_9PEZI|nr:hypothetical protein FKW77_004719 [Venturia effusa]
MSPPSFVPKLSQSKSKADFFRQLGWKENDEAYTRLYQMMMEEAAAGRARTVQSRENLTAQSQADPRTGEGPYSSSMITETARHREIISIYSTSSPETRVWYDRAITNDGTWDNWIIRWCLWHVFRYRDDRNRGSSRHGPGRDAYLSSQAHGQIQPYGQVNYATRLPYDPIYDQYRTSSARYSY